MVIGSNVKQCYQAIQKKQKMKTFQYFFLLFAAFAVAACEEEFNKPVTEGGKPGPVKTYVVKNLPGAVEISYDVPDQHVAYVVAEFEIDGVKRDVKASKFKDNLLIEGFPRAGDFAVRLTAVGRDEQRSESVEIVVSPTTPPVHLAFEKLSVAPDFGGLNIVTENTSENVLTYEVIVETESGWELVDQHSSRVKDIDWSVRGLPPEERRFGIFVKDRWSNRSDTLVAELRPYNEFMIDMSDFYETPLPGDEMRLEGTRRMWYLFDGRKLSHTYSYYTVAGSGMPQHFTIYLQDTYKLSRIMNWQNVTNNTIAYNSSNPRHFRVWGSMDPNPDGSFDDSWILLAEFENIKPSGSPVGTNTQEDNDAARAGDEYVFPRDIPPVRYIRIETLSVWGNTGRVYYTELEIYGDHAD